MRSARRRLFVVAVLAGCGGAERVPPGGGGGGVRAIPGSAAASSRAAEPAAPDLSPDVERTAATPAQDVEVVYDAGDDAWMVTWRFAAATPGVIFDRRFPSNRHARWTAGAGLAWGSEDGHETLRAADGGERTTFSARFATDDESPGRAPPLNVRFSDGGRLLFTAQVAVHALDCEAAAGCARRDRGGARRWVLRSDDPARSVRVLDDAAAGALTWAEPPGDVRGTYVYVGRTEAVAAAGATLVLDAGLPGWLADETRRRLPELLAGHAARTGIALDVVPLVLVSYDRRAAGDAMRGRSLPGLLQLDAAGRAWRTRSADRRRRWFELVAHESFHLWNAHLARRSGDKRDEWLSEGSAVYVAGLALAGAGMLPEAARAARLVGAANGCLATLRTGLFDEAADAAYYACGELVCFLVDRRLAADGGLDALLAATFARARDRGGYATADFLELLAARTGDADPTLADVRAILDHGLGPTPEAFVQAALARAGLPAAVVRRRAGATPRLRVRAARVLRPRVPVAAGR